MGRRRNLRPEEREIWAKVSSHVTPLAGKVRANTAARGTLAGSSKGATSDADVGSGCSASSGGVVSSSGAKAGNKAVTRAGNKTGNKAGNKVGGAGTKRLAAPADFSHNKKVRRGKVEIDGRLDLHGLTQDQARAALFDFIHRGVARGAVCLLVITGKGAGEEAASEYLPWWREAPGVIKRRCPEWLAAPDLRPYVSRTARAHQRHGGDGAMYVFLRAKR